VSYDHGMELWLNWIGKVEEITGHVDGDQTVDGYSLDAYYHLWKLGASPQQAIDTVKDVVL
jgi:hypothetical protein